MRDVYQASKQVTLATGSIVQPTGAGSNIRDPLGNVVCSVVDEVYVQDLTGMGAYLEPYVISEIDARAARPHQRRQGPHRLHRPHLRRGQDRPL